MTQQTREKPFIRVMQLDGWTHCDPRDDLMRGDDDGECILGVASIENRNSPKQLAARLHVPLGTDRKTVLRLLKKMRRWIKGDATIFEGDCEVHPSEIVSGKARRIVASVLVEHDIETDPDLAKEVARMIVEEAADIPF